MLGRAGLNVRQQGRTREGREIEDKDEEVELVVEEVELLVLEKRRGRVEMVSPIEGGEREERGSVKEGKCFRFQPSRCEREKWLVFFVGICGFCSFVLYGSRSNCVFSSWFFSSSSSSFLTSNSFLTSSSSVSILQKFISA